MANYNCTLLGCIQDPTGTYPDLQSCQSACVGWGCPNQLNSNTNILVVLDASGSYQNASSEMQTMYLATIAWKTELQLNGWVGKMKFTSGNYLQGVDGYLEDSNGVYQPLKGANNNLESWLNWGYIPYVAKPFGCGAFPTGFPQDAIEWYDCTAGQVITWPDGSQSEKLLMTWGTRDTLDQANATNTGATYFSADTLVLALVHEDHPAYAGDGGVGAVGCEGPTADFKSDYAIWDIIWDGRTSTCTPKGFLLPVKNQCETYPSLTVGTVQHGIGSILNGNQNDVSNGGTGTLDGTWIMYSQGDTLPDGSVCDQNYCGSYPYGPASINPCDTGHTHCITTNNGAVPDCNDMYQTLCYWAPMPTSCAQNFISLYANPWSVEGCLSYTLGNPWWVAGQPTWGGLEDKGWGLDVTLISNSNGQIMTDIMISQVGTVVTAPTGVTSAQTLYTLNGPNDYPYSSETEAISFCFPYLDPWECDYSLGYCTQQTGGSFGWTNAASSSNPPGLYPTSNAASAACALSCFVTTAWTCTNYGCQVDSAGTFSTLSACTASCQSYSCTTSGCYGPFQGTGGTGTHLEMSSCTATCYHYECVTDVEAVALLPNIYDAGNSSTYGCIQTSGSVNTNISTHYSTLSACTASCVSWGCCEPTAIGFWNIVETPAANEAVYTEVAQLNHLSSLTKV